MENKMLSKDVSGGGGGNEKKLAFLNTQEREKAHTEAMRDFENRLADNPNPTDDERRIGVYVEFLEPQIRDAIVTLMQKGYITIDSGYNGRQAEKGIQYIGFEKGMIDESLLEKVREVVDAKTVTATMEFSQRDFLELIPLRFISLDEWKKIWNDVAHVFPDRGILLPFRERFIDKKGH